MLGCHAHGSCFGCCGSVHRRRPRNSPPQGRRAVPPADRTSTPAVARRHAGVWESESTSDRIAPGSMVDTSMIASARWAIIRSTSAGCS